MTFALLSVFYVSLTCTTTGAAEPDDPVVFVRGDPNGDRKVDISDAIQVLTFQFLGTPQFGCQDSADANDDGQITIADPAFIMRHAFLGESPPPPPLTLCDVDSTDDGLGGASTGSTAALPWTRR
jgi:hypothetical protein